MIFVDNQPSASHIDTNRDIPNQRQVYLKNGRVLKLERRDPYGFIHIIWDKGPTPDIISGAYSDWDKAKDALHAYISSETFTKLVDEAPPSPPPLKFKNVKKEADVA